MIITVITVIRSATTSIIKLKRLEIFLDNKKKFYSVCINYKSRHRSFFYSIISETLPILPNYRLKIRTNLSKNNNEIK